MFTRQLGTTIIGVLAATSLARSQPARSDPPSEPPAPSPPPDPTDEHPDPAAPQTTGSDRDACLAQRREISRQAQTVVDLAERTRILLSLPNCGSPGAVATDAVKPAGAEVPSAPSFALELRIEAAQVLIDSDSASPSTQAGVFFGYRGPTITVGVGFELSRISSSLDAGTASSSASITSVLLIPGLRAVLARSGDDRTEMLGQIDLGYGAGWQSTSSMGNGSSTGHFRGQLGPSVRHWITPTFAVGATTGIRYDRFSQTIEQMVGPSQDASVSITALFTSLQMIGVF